MIGRATSWWDGREPRERILLGILAGLLSLFLLVFLVILPLQSLSDRAETELRQAKSNLTLVSRLAPTSGSGTTRAAFDRSVLITVARDQNIRLTRVQPGTDGTFSVWIDEAETAALYGFFDALIGGYAVQLDRVVVSTDANGRLSAQFTVR